MKTIKLNGEYTKDDLLSKIEELSKYRFEIQKQQVNDNGAYQYVVVDTENDIACGSIGDSRDSFQKNYSTLVYNLADALDILSEDYDILDRQEKKGRLIYSIDRQEFDLELDQPEITSTVYMRRDAYILVDMLNESGILEEFK